MITLRAIKPSDANTVIKTVIDCQGSPTSKHRAIYFHDEEDANTSVEGLTIINGYQDRGGAIWCQSDPTIKNCIFTKNTAGSYGGGVYCYDSNAMITNCTFSDNNAPLKGGGLYCGHNSHVTLSNSILWSNLSAAGHEIAVSISSPVSSLTASYNDVKGGRPEVYVQSGCSVNWKPGNIDADPCFVDAANGDYHLQSSGRQWRDATSSWQTGVRTSPCIDSGNPGTVLGNEPNALTNLRIDMGSFGGTIKASIPPEGWALLADIDNDGTTDEIDFALFAGYWQTKGSDLPADLDLNNKIDFSDLKLFCEDWLKITSE
jgi:predicted outer membrane repeat protein